MFKMKKVSILLLLFLFTFYSFSQNFQIKDTWYLQFGACDITENTITFSFEKIADPKTVSYKKVHKYGMLFYEMSESFPLEYNEGISSGHYSLTSNNLLILAGNQKNHKARRYGKETIYDFILLIAATESFDNPYPFIEPEIYPFNVYNTRYKDCSSFLIEKGIEYKVDNLCALGMDTPWVENVKGDGIGEGFTITTTDRFPYLLIMNGYISYKKPHLYKMNNRVKKLKVTGLKSGKSKILDVLDTPHPQTVDISFITENEDLRIEIADVYKGTKYDDTCIHYLINYEDEVIPYENSISD